ncbi:MAG: hypothetical protein LBF88_12255 [Planctomycetaceae bacterium]|jgi:hypothetical protein|nr:hypothetical protein [Planctomycetaceae bacterium]
MGNKTMKTWKLLCRFAVVVLIFGIVLINQALPQSSVAKQYRKPSESDIEWLLGTPNAQSLNQKANYNVPPCEPAYSPFHTTPPEQTKTPQQPTSSQTSGEITPIAVQEWISSSSEKFFSKVPKKETVMNETPVSPPQNEKYVTNSLSPTNTESAVKSDLKTIPKLTPKSQNTQNTQPCSYVTDYSVPDHSVVTDSNLPKKQNNINDNDIFPCIDCDTISFDYHFDNNVENTCYRICSDWNVPEMVGDTSWTSGRFVGVTSQEKTAFFSVPTALLSRLNLAEHFNAETKNRFWFDYRWLNNATSVNVADFRKSRTADQFTFGLETSLSRCLSVEVRVPVINQFASKQSGLLNSQFNESATEMGNLSLIFKYLLSRSREFTFSGGIGVVFPTAKDWRLPNVLLENKSYYLVPYLGLQWHPNENLFGHFLVQTDISVSDNQLRFGNEKLNIDESTIVRLGWQLGRWFYRNELGSHLCRLGGFLELDWTLTTGRADTGQILHDSENVFVGSIKNKPQSFNIVIGIPVLFGQLAMTNAVILPLTNHDRTFSVGYDFSLSRRF